MADTARVAVQLTLQGASQFSRALTGVTTGFGRMRERISRAGADLFHFMQIGKDMFSLAQRMGSGAMNVANALLGPNEQYEMGLMQLQQLMGSAEAAREHIKYLYEYANSTPFLNPDVISAGKILYNIGGSALGAGEGLTMVGDMAAFANMKLTEMSGVVSRLYSMIQSDDAFGEEARRLMELGFLTGDQIKKLKAMQEAGRTGAEVWSAFSEMMGKFSGMARTASDTMTGAKSTIQGLWGEIKRLAGRDLFDKVKEDIIGIRDDMSDAFATGQIENFTSQASKLIGNLYEELKTKAFGGVTVDTLFDAAEQGKMIELLNTIVKSSAQNFGIALYNTAIKYGPDIQRAIIPDRLHGILGIDAGKQQAYENIASGKGSPEDINKLGFLEQAAGGTWGAMGALWPGETAKGAVQQWAMKKAGTNGQPMPYIDTAAMIAGLGVGSESGGGGESVSGPVAEEIKIVGRTATEQMDKLADSIRKANEAQSDWADKLLEYSAVF